MWDKTAMARFEVLYRYRSEEKEIQILSQNSILLGGDMNPVPHENRLESYIF